MSRHLTVDHHHSLLLSESSKLWPGGLACPLARGCTDNLHSTRQSPCWANRTAPSCDYSAVSDVELEWPLSRGCRVLLVQTKGHHHDGCKRRSHSFEVYRGVMLVASSLLSYYLAVRSTPPPCTLIAVGELTHCRALCLLSLL
jgi:hypothetical protein